jgi:hypothetical protein
MIGTAWALSTGANLKQLAEERGTSVGSVASFHRIDPPLCSLTARAAEVGYDRRDFKSFWGARCTIAGIEVMHAIRKGQLAGAQEMGRTPAEQFCALAA